MRGIKNRYRYTTVGSLANSGASYSATRQSVCPADSRVPPLAVDSIVASSIHAIQCICIHAYMPDCALLMEKQRPRMWRDTHALNRLDVLSLSYYILYKLMRRRAVYHDQAIRYFQQLHYRRYGILFETLEIYSSAKLALTGGFKGGGKGGHGPPKMPEVTRSPCQPKILVCSSTQNVQFKVICSLQS